MTPVREKLRDDRLYVMNLCRGYVQTDGDIWEIESLIGRCSPTAALRRETQHWILTTYRNNPTLPIFRVDKFLTADKAVLYVKRHEPLTPLKSLNAKPISYTCRGEMWLQWKQWLFKNGLESCLAGKLHTPDWAGF